MREIALEYERAANTKEKEKGRWAQVQGLKCIIASLGTVEKHNRA